MVRYRRRPSTGKDSQTQIDTTRAQLVEAGRIVGRLERVADDLEVVARRLLADGR